MKKKRVIVVKTKKPRIKTLRRHCVKALSGGQKYDRITLSNNLYLCTLNYQYIPKWNTLFSCDSGINSGVSNGSNEHHGTKYNQWTRSNHSKRLTHSLSKLARELQNISQQQNKERASSSISFWFLHLTDSQLGSRSERSLSQEMHPCNKNWFHVCSSERASSLVNGSSNMHPASRQRSRNHQSSRYVSLLEEHHARTNGG